MQKSCVALYFVFYIWLPCAQKHAERQITLARRDSVSALGRLLLASLPGRMPSRKGSLENPCFLHVDPYAHEQDLVKEACSNRGIDCIEVFSPWAKKKLETMEGRDENWETAPVAGEERKWLEQIGVSSSGIVGILCGHDAGLATAERLQAALTPSRSNGLNPARRDKYLMHEALRAAGLGAARQCIASTWENAEPFVRKLGGRVVCKPRRGMGSIRVFLAESSHAAEQHVRALLESPAAGLRGDDEIGVESVLLQECLEGEEWIVDTVSRDGEHKALAVWRYRKGVSNGAPFVNFCDELRPVASEVEQSLIDYAFATLDVLEVRWGPTHLEIKMTQDGPVLVEANVGRWNGVDFKMLVDICLGYNSYDATLDAYVDEAAWQALPTSPPERLACAGMLVKLVSHVEGKLRSIRHEVEMEELPSLMTMELERDIGDWVERTVDLATCAGLITLLHGDEEQVDADYNTLRRLQPTLFEVE